MARSGFESFITMLIITPIHWDGIDIAMDVIYHYQVSTFLWPWNGARTSKYPNMKIPTVRNVDTLL